jgi:hypothetical protein
MSQFYSAGLINAIPDYSVDYRYVAESFASPWPDETDTADMSVSGLTESTFNNGEASVYGDGTDYGSATGPQTLPENEDFGVAITTQFSSYEYFFGGRDGNDDFFLRSGSSRSPDGSFELHLATSGNHSEAWTDNQFDDGSVHALIINKIGDDPSNWDFYVDDVSNSSPTSTGVDGGYEHQNYSNTEAMGFWDLFIDGSGGDPRLDGHIGVFEFKPSPYSQSEREAFVNWRPEV